MKMEGRERYKEYENENLYLALGEISTRNTTKTTFKPT